MFLSSATVDLEDLLPPTLEEILSVPKTMAPICGSELPLKQQLLSTGLTALLPILLLLLVLLLKLVLDLELLLLSINCFVCCFLEFDSFLFLCEGLIFAIQCENILLEDLLI